MLSEQARHVKFDRQTDVIDVHICYRRGKIDKEFGVPLLQTLYLAGYLRSESS
jgi:two-component system, OmpR family, response regulator